jgi:hypothetical protein
MKNIVINASQESLITLTYTFHVLAFRRVVENESLSIKDAVKKAVKIYHESGKIKAISYCIAKAGLTDVNNMIKVSHLCTYALDLIDQIKCAKVKDSSLESVFLKAIESQTGSKVSELNLEFVDSEGQTISVGIT